MLESMKSSSVRIPSKQKSASYDKTPSTSPIDNLPAELVALILEFSLKCDANAFHEKYRFPTRLMAVSKWWRTVVLSTPSLWASIYVGTSWSSAHLEYHEATLEVYQRRILLAGMLPLELCLEDGPVATTADAGLSRDDEDEGGEEGDVDDDDDDDNNDQHFILGKSWERGIPPHLRLSSFIERYQERWEKVVIITNRRRLGVRNFINDVWPVSLPNALDIQIVDKDYLLRIKYLMATPIIPTFSAPKLKYMQITASYGTVRWSPMHFPSLQKLVLRSRPETMYHTIHSIHSLGNLRTLVLRLGSFDFGIGRTRPFLLFPESRSTPVFSTLETLSLSEAPYKFVAGFLGTIFTPNLVTLAVECHGNSKPLARFPTYDFPSLRSFAYLELKNKVRDDGTIVGAILLAAPELERLVLAIHDEGQIDDKHGLCLAKLLSRSGPTILCPNLEKVHLENYPTSAGKVPNNRPLIEVTIRRSGDKFGEVLEDILGSFDKRDLFLPVNRST